MIIYMVKSRKNLKGGYSPLPLTPGEYKGVGTIAVAGDANYAKPPNAFSSNQVGGHRRRRKHRHSKQYGGMGYGFSNPAAVPYAAGSYFPITPTCAAGSDASRGGNNFMSGGAMILCGAPLIGGKKKKSGAMILGGAPLMGGTRKWKGGKTKRSKTKRSKSKHSKSKHSKTSKIQKWWQKGCSKLAGGFVPM